MANEEKELVRACMTKDVAVIDGDMLLVEAIDVMRQKGIGSIVVVQAGKLAGIFTERDLITKLHFKDISKDTLSSLKISDVMTRDVKTISPDESYRDVVRLMKENKIRHMPVLENGAIVGIVSQSDVMRHNEESLVELNRELSDKTQQLLAKTSKLNIIMRLSEQLISNMETQDLLTNITKVARELVSADTASVILLKENEGDFAIIASEFSGSNIKSEIVHPSLDAEESITGWVIKNKQPLLLCGRADLDPRFTKIKWKEGIKCSINVPLVYRGVIKGTLNLNIIHSDHIFDEDDLETAVTLANHVSVAIENSTLFKNLQQSLIEYLRMTNENIKSKNEELRIAKERIDNEIRTVAVVQQGLLPRSLPKNSRIDVAAIYAASTTVGGDYYDCLEMDEGKIGIVIADVTGHGLSAAFVMTMIKILLFYLNQQRVSLVETVSTINAMLAQHVPISTFSSLIYGILDLEKMTFEYINAGHEPILCINAANNKRDLYFAKSLLLGVEAKTEFIADTISLQKGDKLFFYTDGISEAMNKTKEFFGRERLADIINNNASKSSKEIIDAVMTDLNAFCDGMPLVDDLTMLALGL